MNRGAGVRKGARPFLLLLLALPLRAAPLWEEADWLRLLHFKGGVSDAKPGPFFLAKEGKTDAKAELEALTAALDDPSPEPPRCRFPARVRWLAGKLGRDAEPLLAPCAKFKAWRDLLAAEGVALVFASAYMNNPSSMFGHTFLRLERAGPDRLLDNSLNFAAETGETSGVLFAVRGLGGRKKHCH